MKRLSLTRILRVLRHAPLPLRLAVASISCSSFFGHGHRDTFCGSKLIGTWSRQLLSVAQSPAHLNTAPSRN